MTNGICKGCSQRYQPKKQLKQYSKWSCLTFLTQSRGGIAKEPARKVTRLAKVITLFPLLVATHQAAGAIGTGYLDTFRPRGRPLRDLQARRPIALTAPRLGGGNPDMKDSDCKE